MKIKLRFFVIIALSACLFSCNNKTDEKIENIEKVVSRIEKNIANNEPIYKLYPTRNVWNFLKLDTRNGKVSIVQYSVKEDNERFEYTLSDKAQCDNTKPGRFILQPTENTYNFIMLDQVSGKTYQVQWSFEEENRFVIPIL